MIITPKKGVVQLSNGASHELDHPHVASHPQEKVSVSVARSAGWGWHGSEFQLRGNFDVKGREKGKDP
jgi:hypothetical protein